VIRAFLFDIGNVLLRFDFQRAIERLREKCDPAAGEVLELIEPIKVEYESGRIDRPMFQQQVREVLKFTGSDPEFVSAWEEIFTEIEPMTAIVRGLRGRYPLYLLSNTSDLHVEYIFRTYPIFECFDGGVYSYAVRAFKPERGIYEAAIAKFGLKPSETLFIDDLEANVAAARELGFRTWQYDWRNHAAFLNELEQLGIAAEPTATNQPV
jgi:FMN phosphatase YigB (HAD superfamily)